MTKNRYISGVGGWLGLVIVGFMVLGPLVGLGRLTNEFHDAERQFPQLATNTQWSSYKQTSWLIFSASVAISFSAGYRLWKIHFSESVRFAILALWLCGPLGNVLYLTSAVLIFGSQAMTGLVGILGSCIIAGIWTAYLMRSLRVKNTYSTSLNTQVAK